MSDFDNAVRNGTIRVIVWGTTRPRDPWTQDIEPALKGVMKGLSVRSATRERIFAPSSKQGAVFPQSVDELVAELLVPSFMTILVGHGPENSHAGTWALLDRQVDAFPAGTLAIANRLAGEPIPTRALIVNACYAEVSARKRWLPLIREDAVLIAGNGSVDISDATRWFSCLLSALAAYRSADSVDAGQIAAAFTLTRDFLRLQDAQAAVSSNRDDVRPAYEQFELYR